MPSQKSPKEKRAADKQDLAYLNSLTASHAELIDTPKSHYLFIGAVECISTALPIGLFFTQYYRADSLLEAAPQFAIGTFVGAVVLAFAVNKWAVAVRKTLHAEREKVISTKTPAEKSALKQSAFVESTAAAMSSLNLCYFLAYLVFATYVLPGHKLSDKNNYMFSSLGAAVASLAVCSVYHSIKL